MDQEAVISGIKKRWGGSPTGALCIQIANQIFALSPEETRFLTYETILKFVTRDKLDQEVLAALNILTTSQFAIFEAHGLFIDGDGKEYDLDSEELNAVIYNGELVHPDSGELILDAGKMVCPYFALLESK